MRMDVEEKPTPEDDQQRGGDKARRLEQTREHDHGQHQDAEAQHEPQQRHGLRMRVIAPEQRRENHQQWRSLGEGAAEDTEIVGDALRALPHVVDVIDPAPPTQSVHRFK